MLTERDPLLSRLLGFYGAVLAILATRGKIWWPEVYDVNNFLEIARLFFLDFECERIGRGILLALSRGERCRSKQLNLAC